MGGYEGKARAVGCGVKRSHSHVIISYENGCEWVPACDISQFIEKFNLIADKYDLPHLTEKLRVSSISSLTRYSIQEEYKYSEPTTI